MTIRGKFAETVVGAPPEGWTLGHVTLTLHSPPERIAVEAWRRGAFAVHQVFWPESGGRLTHAPTGLKIWCFASMDEAAELAEKIEPLADWNSIREMLPSGTELYPKVRTIIDEIGERGSAAAP